MRRKLLLIGFVLLYVSVCLATSPHGNPTSAFDGYGRIRWEDEKARLDNFAIQLTMETNSTGYFLVRAGKSSCKLEAQDHALRARNYLMKVRHIPWNRVIWRDTGYGDDFQVTIWIVSHGSHLTYEYDAATPQHIIHDCRRRRR
jgi:hypothetical protein